MKLHQLLLYGVLMLSLTACPFLDPPSPLTPLAQPKTQKTSYKTGTCRQKNSAAVYSAEGLLLSTGSSEWDMQYVYDANGFLIKGSNKYYTVIFEYDANGLLKTATYTNFDKQLFPDRLKEVFAYVDGRLKEDRLTYINNEEYKMVETDGQGRIVKAFSYGFDLATNKVSMNGYNLRSYDAANNWITTEFRDQDGNLSQLDNYEYDDHPAPPVYIPKGHQLMYRDGHNQTKYSSVGYFAGTIVSESLTAKSYIYNETGYPLKVESKTTIKSSDFPAYETTSTVTYEYEGCL